jgi:hypothetical protein
MLMIRNDQMQQMARAMFIGKVDRSFQEDVPGFRDLDIHDRDDFILEGMAAAERLGLKTEQGIVSYLLGVWWLGPEFETSSSELEALLHSDYPEVRKVHAMNEWVQTVIGDPDNIAAANQKLKEALQLTEAWGK